MSIVTKMSKTFNPDSHRNAELSYYTPHALPHNEFVQPANSFSSMLSKLKDCIEGRMKNIHQHKIPSFYADAEKKAEYMWDW